VRSIEQSLDIETLFTVVFMLVDDWFRRNPRRQVGRKAIFSDSEVVSLVLVMDFVPYPSERQYLAYVRANYLQLFPRLLDQSQFNVRARSLRYAVEQLRKHWQHKLLEEVQAYLLLDTKPVPVMTYKRSKAHSDFLDSAAYGYCASRSMKYYGYKLVMFSSLDGLPISYELVPANTDERRAAEELLEQFPTTHLLTDKGFIGDFWQQELRDSLGITILCPKRRNQKPNDPGLEPLWGSLRQRVEGVFNELQNLGKNLERLSTKTVVGLTARVAALITSHTLKLLLKRSFGFDVQSFSVRQP
jgi:hypothetical protein